MSLAISPFFARVPIWGALAIVCGAIGLLAGIEPALAIMASLGLAFAFVAFVNLPAGVGLFALIVLMEALVRTGSLLSLIKLAGLVLAISWLAQVAVANRERAKLLFDEHPHLAYLLALFVVWVGIGLVWAENQPDVLTDASRYALNFALIAIIFTAAAGRREFRWLLGAFIVGIAITALYGLIVRPVTDPRKVARLASAVGNPNELAAVLLAGEVLALGAFFALKGYVVRFPLLAIATVCLVAQILTGSRGAIIALAVTLLTAIVFAGRWRLVVTGLTTLILTGAVTYTIAFAPESIQERLVSVTPGELRASDEPRGTIWQVGLRVGEDNVLTGVGGGNFNDVSSRYLLGTTGATRSEQVVDELKTPHNMYLQTFAEQGLPGLLMFLGIIGLLAGSALAAARRFAAIGDQRMEIISRAVFVASIGVLVAGFFSAHQFAKWLWFLLAFGPVLLTLARSAGAEEASEQAPPPPPEPTPAAVPVTGGLPGRPPLPAVRSAMRPASR